MDIDAIIKALGGSRAVQTLLDVGPSAVSNYRKRRAFPLPVQAKIRRALAAKGILAEADTLAPLPQSPSPDGDSAMPQILLIITGGIAAYKTGELIRRMRDEGWRVRAILTPGGAEFITPLTISALTEQRCYTDLFSLTDEAEMGHIRLVREADAIIIAPASADFIAKIAHGLADDLASTAMLAAGAEVPILIAPAMNPLMWSNPATRANCAILRERGAMFIGPDSGDTACGEHGEGRLAATPDMINALRTALQMGKAGAGVLRGRHALVTSGPTHEPIDSVRYIANRSSGKQGHAIAAALLRAGARVTLITGPVAEPPPPGAAIIRIETAKDMLAAAIAALPADIAVCAAAVGDWRMRNHKDGKMKKTGGKPPALTLAENPDILATISRHKKRPRLVIGFAAEAVRVEKAAKAKRIAKGCDWICANDVGGRAVFGKEENKVFFITEAGTETWPRMAKTAVAERLVAKIGAYLAQEAAHAEG